MLFIRILLPLPSIASGVPYSVHGTRLALVIDADRVDVAGAQLGLPSLRYRHSALQLAPAPFGSYTDAWYPQSGDIWKHVNGHDVGRNIGSRAASSADPMAPCHPPFSCAPIHS